MAESEESAGEEESEQSASEEESEPRPTDAGATSGEAPLEGGEATDPTGEGATPAPLVAAGIEEDLAYEQWEDDHDEAVASPAAAVASPRWAHL